MSLDMRLDHLAPKTGVGELIAFRNPQSVAVVGASGEKSKWGFWLAQGALKGQDRRKVYLVNRTGIQILGQNSFRTLGDLPEVPELVAVSVPGPAVLGVIKDGLAIGAKSFLVVSARVEHETEIAALLKEHHAYMVGPNSLGLYSAEGELQLMWGAMTPGTLAIVSQSGQIGSEIAALGLREKIGVSQFVSLGSQVSLNAQDILRSLCRDPQTLTVGLYIEDFSRGAEIVEAISELRENGKAVLVLTTGESTASKNLAQTHTGAMTSDSQIVNAACRAAGGLRVHTPTELVHIAAFIERAGSPSGRRVAIVSDSGGQGGIAADQAARLGLDVPELSSKLRRKLDALLPAGASSVNPIDLAGAGEANMRSYATLTRMLAESGEVDSVVLSGYFGSYGKDVVELQDLELEVAREIGAVSGTVIAVHSMDSESLTCQELMTHGVYVTGRIEDVLGALSGAELANARPRNQAGADAATPQLMLSSSVSETQTLSQWGISFPQSRVVRSAQEAGEVARVLDTTLVLKAGGLLHKTEMGGVKLGLDGVTAAAEAFEEMYARLGERDYTLEVQDTREHVVEFIVSARRDSNFGPVVSVGFGGVQTEIWSDLETELAPVDRKTAAAMINNLRSAKLLAGWRGAPALNIEALIDTVVATAGALCAFQDIEEIELNPVRVGPDNAVAVDCVVVRS
jgi:acyl-CoA synthetase (NDP forming)